MVLGSKQDMFVLYFVPSRFHYVKAKRGRKYYGN